MFTKNSVGYSLCNFCYLYFLFSFVYLLLFNVCHSLQEIHCFSFFIFFDIFFVAQDIPKIFYQQFAVIFTL